MKEASHTGSIPNSEQSLSITVENLFLLVAKLKHDIEVDNFEFPSAEIKSNHPSEKSEMKLPGDNGKFSLQPLIISQIWDITHEFDWISII